MGKRLGSDVAGGGPLFLETPQCRIERALVALKVVAQTFGHGQPPRAHRQTGEDVVAKMRCMQVSSTSLKTGDTLTVTMQGSGLETQCSTTVLLSHKATTTTKSAKKVGTGAWPQVSTFVLTHPAASITRMEPAAYRVTTRSSMYPTYPSNPPANPRPQTTSNQPSGEFL